MHCKRSTDDIHALIDGTLGPIRASELERHLDECDTCRALADDLRRIRDVADTLDDPQPADHVWLQIAGRLRQEGRIHDQPALVATRRQQYVWVGIAAALVLAVGTSLLLLIPQFRGSTTRPDGTAQQSNAAGANAVQSGVEDLRKAEQLLQSGVAKLKEGLGSEEQALPTGMAGTLDLNLQIPIKQSRKAATRCRRNRRTSRRATVFLRRCSAKSRCCRTRSR